MRQRMRNRILKRDLIQIKKSGNELDLIVYALLKNTLQYDELTAQDYKGHIQSLSELSVKPGKLLAMCEDYLKSKHREN